MTLDTDKNIQFTFTFLNLVKCVTKLVQNIKFCGKVHTIARETFNNSTQVYGDQVLYQLAFSRNIPFVEGQEAGIRIFSSCYGFHELR